MVGNRPDWGKIMNKFHHFVILLLACTSWACIHPHPTGPGPGENSFPVCETSNLWDQKFFGDCEPLENLPVIASLKKLEGYQIEVCLMNVGSSALHYSGYGPQAPQMFIESFEDGEWKDGDWCGTGLETYTLPPGESITLQLAFRMDWQGQRLLTIFSDENGDQSSLVVMGTILPHPILVFREQDQASN